MFRSFLEYQLYKLYSDIIFEDEKKDYSNEKYYFEITALESLKNIINYYVTNNFLSEKMKNRISNFLFQVREFKDELYEKRVEIINDIIKIMNNQKEDCSLIFYRIELRKRIDDPKYLIKYSNEEIKTKIGMVDESIGNDLFVVIGCSEYTTEEQFTEEYLPDLLNEPLFYESLNAILDEYPDSFKDKVFYDRVMSILTLKNELKKDKKLNKKFIKEIKRKV